MQAPWRNVRRVRTDYELFSRRNHCWYHSNVELFHVHAIVVDVRHLQLAERAHPHTRRWRLVIAPNAKAYFPREKFIQRIAVGAMHGGYHEHVVVHGKNGIFVKSRGDHHKLTRPLFTQRNVYDIFVTKNVRCHVHARKGLMTSFARAKKLVGRAPRAVKFAIVGVHVQIAHLAKHATTCSHQQTCQSVIGFSASGFAAHWTTLIGNGSVATDATAVSIWTSK